MEPGEQGATSPSLREGRHECIDLLEDFAGTADDQVMSARNLRDASPLGECGKPFGVTRDIFARQWIKRLYPFANGGIVSVLTTAASTRPPISVRRISRVQAHESVPGCRSCNAARISLENPCMT